ncbi:MAG: GNAT family N-acetyltransferase [Amaricoccus sp.]
MPSIETAPIADEDRAAVDALSRRHWADTRVVYVQGAIDTRGLPGAVARIDGAFAGAVTWLPEDGALRIVTIASALPGRGAGRALLAAVEAAAREDGLARVVVSTVNSNLHALGFYQRNGYALAALHRGAVAGLRRLKPAIPEVDANGIPIRDQIDLEKRLG